MRTLYCMHKSWLPLECMACGTQWEQAPDDLPPSGHELHCDQCGLQRPVSEFMRTAEGLKILEQFHQ